MKVLGFIDSPRIGSNTDLLVTSILEGATANKNSTEKVYLYPLDIKPCVDCKACKKGALQCAIKDGMTSLYSKLEESDVIVFGTPLYWYGPSAKMKLLIDRLRPFVASKKLAGKKAVVVVPSEEGAEACNLTVEMYRMSLKYLGMDLVNVLLPTASEKAEVKQQPQTLKAGFEIGQTLK
ncbi:MAG: flavodoxin family protein [Candidatus Bathyarchaeia archaeon]|jgi:multimeric flavodoxin WrbA